MINKYDTFTEAAIKSCLGLKVTKAYILHEKLHLEFNGGVRRLLISDEGQSCCEHRYMHTDDDLSEFVDAPLVKVDVAHGPEEKTEWEGMKESEFLNVTTGKGTFTVVNYNEHNGYYGGFCLMARTETNKGV